MILGVVLLLIVVILRRFDKYEEVLANEK